MAEINFKVRIHCDTFNHSAYIQDAFDGFVSQKTQFPFVAVIFDDASTDGGQDVILSYLRNNFKIRGERYYYEKDEDCVKIYFAQHQANANCFFAVLLSKYNHYSIKKDRTLYYEKWPADYIARCEGDDYWTDSLKLQKQVDFLETNTAYGMCYTKVIRYHQAEGKIKDIWGGDYELFEQMITKNTVPTLTTLLRHDMWLKYRKTAYRDSSWLMGDYPMWLWFAAESRIKFIDEVTATYRILPESLSHSFSLKKIWRFSNSFFCIQKYYIHTYLSILSDDCVQSVYCKAYRGLLPAAVALGNVDFVKEVGHFMKSNRLPPIVTVIYKFHHIFKPFLIMWYRLKGLCL